MRLKIVNAIAAFFHSAQFVAICIIIGEHGSVHWPLSVTRYAVVETKNVIDLAYILPVPAFISAVAHVLYETVLYDRYSTMIERGYNWLRWIEYSLSAGVMIVIISVMCGISEISTLVCFVLLNILLQLCGGLGEIGTSYLREDHETSAFPASSGMRVLENNIAFISNCLLALGILQFLVTWGIIAFFFFSSVYDSSQSEHVPDIVWAIIIIMFLFFASFGVVYVCSWPMGKKQKPLIKDFRTTEGTYIVLSFVSKSVLQWMIVGGALRGYEET